MNIACKRVLTVPIGFRRALLANNNIKLPFNNIKLQNARANSTANTTTNASTAAGKPLKIRDLYRPKQMKKKSDVSNYGYFLLFFPVLTFVLGTWQVYRRSWKLGLIENMNSRINHEPIDLPENMEEMKKYEYYPVRVRGTFKYDNEVLIGPQSLIVGGEGASEKGTGIISGSSHTGFYVVTPFELEGKDETILINRGWIPQTYRKKVDRQKGHQGVVEIVGRIRLEEQRAPFRKSHIYKDTYNLRDIKKISQQLGTSPIFLDLVKDSQFPGGPVAGQTKVTLRNEHFTYVVTWYMLSAFSAYQWCKMCYPEKMKYYIKNFKLLRSDIIKFIRFAK